MDCQSNRALARNNETSSICGGESSKDLKKFVDLVAVDGDTTNAEVVLCYELRNNPPPVRRPLVHSLRLLRSFIAVCTEYNEIPFDNKVAVKV